MEFGLQRQLGSNLMLGVSYVGTRGERIFVNGRNLNLPFDRDRSHLNHGPLSYILGDWDVNGIWTAKAGSVLLPYLEPTFLIHREEVTSARTALEAETRRGPAIDLSLVRYDCVRCADALYIRKLRHRNSFRSGLLRRRPQPGTAFPADGEVRP
jgi:hypothetical protein